MFNSKIVFVLGAGSSHEFNLPTGEGLKDSIRVMLDLNFDAFSNSFASGHPGIAQALVRLSQGAGGSFIHPSYLAQKAQRIREALPLAISIDNLLDNYRGDKQIEIVGKLAIVASILQAEKASTVFTSTGANHRPFDIASIVHTWIGGFIRILTENAARSDLDSLFTNVTFLNFNYDRCVEHCLYNALSQFYDLNEREAAEILMSLKVYHPYGAIGALPWLKKPDVPQVGYGDSKLDLLEPAKQIKTFTERSHEPTEVAKMKAAIQEAHIIVFLGFAFHRQNLELIKPDGACNAQMVIGTALGRSRSDQLTITNELRDFFDPSNAPDINLHRELKCAGLINEYARTLPTT